MRITKETACIIDDMKEPTGTTLMAAGALLLPLVDGAAKELGTTHSPWMLGWARYAIAAALLLPFLYRGRTKIAARSIPVHLMRTALLTAAMTCYFIALQHVPLVTAVTAYFVGPILAMILGVAVLGESLTSRKVISGTAGSAGVWVVTGPSAGFDAGVLLALAAGGLYALYLIALRAPTRTAGPEVDPATTLAIQCLLATILLAPAATATWTTPTTGEIWLFGTLGGLSVVSQGLTIAALAKAEASTLAPLVYLELVGAAAVGLLFFQETPTPQTVLGAIIIIAASLTLTRGRCAHRTQPVTRPPEAVP